MLEIDDEMKIRRNIHEVAMLSQMARFAVPIDREMILEEIRRRTEHI